MSDILFMPTTTTWVDVLLGIGPAFIVGFVSIAITRLSNRMEREKQIRDLRVEKSEHYLRLVFSYDQRMNRLKELFYSGEDSEEGRSLIQKLNNDLNELRIQELFYLKKIKRTIAITGAPSYTVASGATLAMFKKEWELEKRKHAIKEYTVEEQRERTEHPYNNPNHKCPFDNLWYFYQVGYGTFEQKMYEYAQTLIEEPKTLRTFKLERKRKRFEKNKKETYLRHDKEMYDEIQRFEEEQEKHRSVNNYCI